MCHSIRHENMVAGFDGKRFAGDLHLARPFEDVVKLIE
jgi:hypothetical protein